MWMVCFYAITTAKTGHWKIDSIPCYTSKLSTFTLINLVVYALPENGHASNQLRNVCQALNIPKGQTKITNCTRLGLMNHTHNQKPRPLLITLKAITMKRDILSKAKSLRSSVHYNKVFVAQIWLPPKGSKTVDSLQSLTREDSKANMS